MTRRFALGALALLGSGSAFAQEFAQGSIRITGAWTMATPPSSKVAGGFMTIANIGKSADRLVGGSTEVSGAVEVHEMRLVNGVMMMRTVDPGITIRPGAKVVLKPFSHHLMLMDLRRQLKAGESVKARLVFEKAGTIDIVLSVEPIGARGPGARRTDPGSGTKPQ